VRIAPNPFRVCTVGARLVDRVAGIRGYLLPGTDASSNSSWGGARSSVEWLETHEHCCAAGGGAECERPAWFGVVGDHTDKGNRLTTSRCNGVLCLQAAADAGLSTSVPDR
jgi:hypothetical protein